MVPEETIAEIEQDRLSLIQTLNRVAIESEKEVRSSSDHWWWDYVI